MDKCCVKICRLCLSMIKDENYDILDEFRIEMLETILINNLKLFVSSDPIICCNCTQCLQKCYDFKTICLNNQFIKSVKTFMNVNDPLEANLEVKIKFKGGKTRNGQKMCRLCFSVDSHYYANVSDDFGDGPIQNMLMRCIPELDLDLTNEPLVCQACLYLLKRQLTFIQHCLELEEKINLFCKQKNKSNRDIVDLHDVQLFFERLDMRNDSDRNIPIFVNESNPPAELVFIKTEPDCDIYENAELDISDNVEMKINETALIKNEPDCEICENAELDNSDNVEMKINKTALIKKEPDCQIWENAVVDISENVEMKVEHNNGENGDSNGEEENRNLRKQDQENSNTLKERSSSILDTTNSDKEFSCSQCSSITKYKSSMNMYTHSNDPLKCQNCSVESKNSHNVTKHSAILKRKQIFRCSQCTYTSKDKKLFMEHSGNHENSSKKYMFRCSLCKYATHNKKYLRKHFIVHKDIPENEMFTCYICSFKCKRKASLKSHVLTHNNPSKMMYKCEQCSYGTRIKRYFKYHLKWHKDFSSKRYKCEKCDYATKRSFDLKRHIKLIH